MIKGYIAKINILEVSGVPESKIMKQVIILAEHAHMCVWLNVTNIQ